MPGTLKTYKARGIVLNSLKYGDSAMVVHLLTDALGRQSYMVQGVRSSRGRGSKLALFQPMFALEFEGRHGLGGQHVAVGRGDAHVDGLVARGGQLVGREREVDAQACGVLDLSLIHI